MDPKTARRLVVALCFSAAVHAALLSLLKAEPGGAGGTGTTTVQAWLERTNDDTAQSDSERAPMTVPDAEADAAVPATPVELARAAPSPTPDAKEVTQSSAASKPGAHAGVGIPLTDDLTYYSVAALDTPPRPLGPADLCYPEGASGEVAYVLLIDEAGTVSQASIVAVKPDGIFTAAAIESCRALKFAPAIKDGRAVRSRVRFVVGPSPS